MEQAADRKVCCRHLLWQQSYCTMTCHHRHISANQWSAFLVLCMYHSEASGCKNTSSHWFQGSEGQFWSQSSWNTGCLVAKFFTLQIAGGLTVNMTHGRLYTIYILMCFNLKPKVHIFGPNQNAIFLLRNYSSKNNTMPGQRNWSLFLYK